MKSKLSLCLTILLNCFYAISQTLPTIVTPDIAAIENQITDTVYMAVNGDDSNPGTASQPVKTFIKAIQLLPFGTQGVNNGNAYGLVILKEGHYLTENGFGQPESQWKNGNTYKNVSVEGEGKVMIGGTPQNPASNTLLVLRGSGIFIKNIKLRYGLNIGLHISGEARFPRTCSNIVIENVEVDSVASHGMLLGFCEKVLANNVVVRHSGAWDPPIPPHDCKTWPSGFKPFMSAHVSIQHSTVAENWGEGVNFQNCEYALVQNCEIHDNYAVNIYNDNSSKYIVRNNLIYNTPNYKKFWRACYGYENAPVSGKGISISNERSCPVSRGYLVNRTIDCVLECVNTIQGNYLIPNVDSMFIYNNFILNTGTAISFWEGVTELARSCINNVWVVHNTCIGVDGDSALSNANLIRFQFPSGINLQLKQLSSIENTVIAQNIFSFNPQKHPNMSISRRNLNNLFPAPFDVKFSNNIWSTMPETYAFDTTSLIDNQLIMHLNYEDNQRTNPLSVALQGNEFDFAKTDFEGQSRFAWRPGAMEYFYTSIPKTGEEHRLKIYPNPASSFLNIKFPFELHAQILAITLYDANGKAIEADCHPISKNELRINTSNLPHGIYFIKATHQHKQFYGRFVVGE
jgi:hypothetical protein